MATVTIGLMCEEEYMISAGGTLNGDLVGPRSPYGTINAGYCPQVMTTTTSPATTTMTGKDNIVICSTLCGRLKENFCSTNVMLHSKPLLWNTFN